MDRKLMRGFLQDKDGSIRTWRNWLVALRLFYGLKVNVRHADLVLQCTGRKLESFKADGKGFQTALFLTGRRSGKSRIGSLVAAYHGVFSGIEDMVSPGETAKIVLVSPTKKQAKILRDYVFAVFSNHSSSLLSDEIVNETQEGFLLSSGIEIAILVADYRSIRGHSVGLALCDEVCFLQSESEGRVRSDWALIQAIKPSLATLSGKILAISSKYSRVGWAFRVAKKSFGNPEAATLYWEAPSILMNPTLDKKIIEEAYKEDNAAARSEFGNCWRDDISLWLSEETILSAVIKGRVGLMGRRGISYSFFADISGGRAEDSCLAIGHKDDGSKKAILDMLYVYKAPNSPVECIADMCRKIKRFSGQKIVADNYSANFVSDAFKANHIAFSKCELPKSKLYLELIGNICSGQVEILDHETLIRQLCSLERRTRSGGKDSVDHPPGKKDDCANSLAGLVWILQGGHQKRAGVFL